MKNPELADGNRLDVNRPEQIGGATKASGNGTKYTCPMHPEIEQDHPGQCPKCGMTLEPKTIGGVDEHEHTRSDRSR